MTDPLISSSGGQGISRSGHFQWKVDTPTCTRSIRIGDWRIAPRLAPPSLTPQLSTTSAPPDRPIVRSARLLAHPSH